MGRLYGQRRGTNVRLNFPSIVHPSRLPLVTKWSAVKSAASAVSAAREGEEKEEQVGQRRKKGRWGLKRKERGAEGVEEKEREVASSFLFPGMAEAFPSRGRKPIKPGCPAARMYRK